MEVAAADGDRKILRNIAKKLLDLAEDGNLCAIAMIADRLDGKPAQESTVTVNKHDACDWTRDELVAYLHERRAGGNGAATSNGSGSGPDKLH
jgi:hypothetical protein